MKRLRQRRRRQGIPDALRRVYPRDTSIWPAPRSAARAAAPVTIVEFSDFHCPFCRQVQPVLLQMLQKYGHRVRLVYKDMPIDGLHPQARGVAEAARCAADQGRFWEFHDKVYANPPDGSAVTLQRLRVAGRCSMWRASRRAGRSRKHQARRPA